MSLCGAQTGFSGLLLKRGDREVGRRDEGSRVGPEGVRGEIGCKYDQETLYACINYHRIKILKRRDLGDISTYYQVWTILGCPI